MEKEKKVVEIGLTGMHAIDMKLEGSNLTFVLLDKSHLGLIFRIYFDAKKGRGSRSYRVINAMNVYFEGFYNPTSGTTVEVNRITDMCLFVERKSQWLIEYLIREAT